MALIKSKKIDNSIIHSRIIEVINENDNISKHLYKILYELILLEDNDNQIGN